MKVPFVDLIEQYHNIRTEIELAIHSVLDQGSYVSGPFVASFEKNFASKHEAKYCIAVSSGTSALHLALWALGITQGDEVIVPTHTFIASASSISLTGATPIFADCSEDDFNIDPEKIEALITPKTKAIIVVHLYGQPAKLDAIKKIAEKHKLLLIEDAAQAHLASYKDKPVGTFGICGCFSFYPGKNLGAYGEGGAILTNDEALYQKCMMLKDHGSNKKYYHTYVGQNYRMQGLQGAILDVKLKHLDQWTNARREKATLYQKYLKGIDKIKLPQENEGVKHVYHLYVIRTEERNKMIEFLNQNEIQVGIHYPIPCHLQECFSHLGYKEGHFPISEKIAAEIISLPMYPELTDDAIHYVSKKIREFYYA